MAWRLQRPLISVSCHDDLTASSLNTEALNTEPLNTEAIEERLDYFVDMVLSSRRTAHAPNVFIPRNISV